MQWQYVDVGGFPPASTSFTLTNVTFASGRRLCKQQLLLLRPTLQLTILVDRQRSTMLGDRHRSTMLGVPLTCHRRHGRTRDSTTRSRGSQAMPSHFSLGCWPLAARPLSGWALSS